VDVLESLKSKWNKEQRTKKE